MQQAQIARIIDGDTFEVMINGVSNRVRIYRADTPETQNEQHCGDQEATTFATWALSFNDTSDTVYIEKDKTEKDRYGRELGYVWFTVEGQPYLLNHILINNGFAEDVDYGDRMYDKQLKDAAAFAKRHDLGVWGLCGGFGIPLASVQAPVASGPRQASAPQQEVPVAQQPVVEQPVYEELAPASGGCSPNYTECVPIVGYDFDCADIGYSVQVNGVDIHGLYGNDNDGWSCESS